MHLCQSHQNTHTFIYICTHTYKHTYIHTHIYAHTVRIYMNIYIYMYVCVCQSHLKTRADNREDEGLGRRSTWGVLQCVLQCVAVCCSASHCAHLDHTPSN